MEYGPAENKNDEDENIKTIFLQKVKSNNNPKNDKVAQKSKKSREITKTITWVKQITKEDFSTTSQLLLLENPFDSANKKQVFVYSQIKQKINGYRHQDILKQKLNADKFVDLDFVIKLLFRSNLLCFYCRELVFLLYEMVRDPKQWTLERVYNIHGHNKDNVEICCLSCNIKRRTMFHEKYKFTKQITFQKET